MNRPQLIQEIIAKINTNADNRITGKVLQDILIKVVDGTQINIIGMAYPDTEPETGIEELTFMPVYVAAGTGIYNHFDDIELNNELALLKYSDGLWYKDTIVLLDEIEFPQVSEMLEKAEKWANEDEDVPVEEGKFSARHYALKSGDYAVDSESASILAKNYANANENVEVEENLFSAKHFSEKASQSASNASTSASTATTQAGIATTKANEASADRQTVQNLKATMDTTYGTPEEVDVLLFTHSDTATGHPVTTDRVLRITIGTNIYDINVKKIQ